MSVTENWYMLERRALVAGDTLHAESASDARLVAGKFALLVDDGGSMAVVIGSADEWLAFADYVRDRFAPKRNPVGPSSRTICEGSGQPIVEDSLRSRYGGHRTLALCPSCGRVTTPRRIDGKWLTRRHSIRGVNTASHDKTSEHAYVMLGGKLPGE